MQTASAADRGPALTWPNCVPSEVLPSGLKNCVWLKMLKNSARKSTCLVSDSGMVFRIAKSVLLMCGPQQIVRGHCPKFPAVPDRSNRT